MLPKYGHSVGKKKFLYSIIKIYDVNYHSRHLKNIFCNLTIFELVIEIGDFESLWLLTKLEGRAQWPKIASNGRIPRLPKKSLATLRKSPELC